MEMQLKLSTDMGKMEHNNQAMEANIKELEGNEQKTARAWGARGEHHTTSQTWTRTRSW